MRVTNVQLTLGLYYFCKVPINMSVQKTIGKIVWKVIEKKDSKLAEVLKLETERRFASLANKPQREQIDAILRHLESREP